MADKPHGASMYKYQRCRCPECRRSNAKVKRDFRASQARQVVDGVHPTAPHGTPNGYDVYCCRCGSCRTAKREQLKQWRAVRLSERVEIDGRLAHPRAPHGTRNGYQNFGCRCIACTASNADRYHRRKAARAAEGHADASTKSMP